MQKLDSHLPHGHFNPCKILAGYDSGRKAMMPGIFSKNTGIPRGRFGFIKLALIPVELSFPLVVRVHNFSQRYATASSTQLATNTRGSLGPVMGYLRDRHPGEPGNSPMKQDGKIKAQKQP